MWISILSVRNVTAWLIALRINVSPTLYDQQRMQEDKVTIYQVIVKSLCQQRCNRIARGENAK